MLLWATVKFVMTVTDKKRPSFRARTRVRARARFVSRVRLPDSRHQEKVVPLERNLLPPCAAKILVAIEAAVERKQDAFPGTAAALLVRHGHDADLVRTWIWLDCASDTPDSIRPRSQPHETRFSQGIDRLS